MLTKEYVVFHLLIIDSNFDLNPAALSINTHKNTHTTSVDRRWQMQCVCICVCV